MNCASARRLSSALFPHLQPHIHSSSLGSGMTARVVSLLHLRQSLLTWIFSVMYVIREYGMGNSSSNQSSIDLICHLSFNHDFKTKKKKKKPKQLSKIAKSRSKSPTGYHRSTRHFRHCSSWRQSPSNPGPEQFIPTSHPSRTSP